MAASLPNGSLTRVFRRRRSTSWFRTCVGSKCQRTIPKYKACCVRRRRRGTSSPTRQTRGASHASGLRFSTGPVLDRTPSGNRHPICAGLIPTNERTVSDIERLPNFLTLKLIRDGDKDIFVSSAVIGTLLYLDDHGASRAFVPLSQGRKDRRAASFLPSYFD
jgi:hypothetical protein